MSKTGCRGDCTSKSEEAARSMECVELGRAMKQRPGRRHALPKWEAAGITSGRRLGLKIQLKEFGGNVVP